MKRKKILGICGVQKKSGLSSSEFLLQEALKAAEEEGADIKLVRLVDFNILRCEACGFCLSNRHCPLLNNPKDEHARLYELCCEADAFIFSSPVYALSLPSIWKNWIDRCDPCSEDDLSYEYYNYDTVQQVKGKSLRGKVAGQIAVSAGLGHEMALSMLMPAFTAVKLTIVANLGLSLIEYDSEPGIRNQTWSKDIKEAKFAIEMSRALGKRVFETIGFSAFDIDQTNRTILLHEKEKEIQALDMDMLEDSEGQKVSLEYFQGRLMILVAASQMTSQYASAWVDALATGYESEKCLSIFNLAVVGQIPHFITRDFVKANVLANAKNIPSIFDWNKDFSNQYGIEVSESPSILLVDVDKRKILFSRALAFNDGNKALVKERIDRWVLNNAKSGG